MTGTNRCNRCFAGTAALALLAAMMPPPLVADDLILEGNERLSGKVRAIDPDGTVLLDTPLAPAAVALKGESIREVRFSESGAKLPRAGYQVALVNGDVLPAEIEAVDDRNVTLRASVAGPLVIPRAMVASLRVGGSQPDVVFSGPEGLGGWTRDRTSPQPWLFDKGALRALGSGTISRNLELPQNFIVRFKLEWGAVPNFKFYFAGPANSGDAAVDQYYLQFNSAGMEIKRESASGRHFPEMNARMSRLPDRFRDKRLEVEIQVNRDAGTLLLLLNGEQEGPFKDPLPKAPTGGRIVFQTLAEEGSDLGVSDIQVLAWDLKDVSQLSKEHGDKTKDALKTISKESFSGTLVGTKPGPDGLIYVLKSAFQDEPVEVPEALVATIFLAVPVEEQAVAPPSPFSLRFVGGGSLRVGSCTFSENQVEVTHPLLGPLKLPRERITAFERVNANPKAEKKKS